jgi:hypothetical protein
MKTKSEHSVIFVCFMWCVIGLLTACTIETLSSGEVFIGSRSSKVRRTRADNPSDYWSTVGIYGVVAAIGWYALLTGKISAKKREDEPKHVYRKSRDWMGNPIDPKE